MKKILPLAICLVVLAWVTACAILLGGCGTVNDAPDTEPTERRVEGNTEIMPQNVIQIGESFSFYPQKADGELRCTVTKVWVVEEQSQCPPEESFALTGLWAYPEGDSVGRIYRYNEWFAEGGAFDLGARFLMVELSVTNVDAVAWLDDGTTTGSSGWFTNPYLFYAYAPIFAADLSVVQGEEGREYFSGGGELYYFSEMGKYSEDDLETVGIETYGIEILPGETVTYTLGYGVSGNPGGQTMDLSKLWLAVSGTMDVDEGIFIDTKLGDDAT